MFVVHNCREDRTQRDSKRYINGSLQGKESRQNLLNKLIAWGYGEGLLGSGEEIMGDGEKIMKDWESQVWTFTLDFQ